VVARVFTGRSDVVVWTPTPDHIPAATDALIGPLVTSVPLRTDPPADSAVFAIVAAVRDKMSTALVHSDSGPITHAGRRIACVVDEAYGPTVRLDARGESTLTALPAVHPAATTDLTVMFRRSVDGMRIAIEYRQEYYTESDIEELQILVPTVVLEMAENLDRPVSRSSTVSKVGV
jgi:hypothetical protein